MSYSQNDEEKQIIAYVDACVGPEPRRFLDVGAFHPKTFSNTRALVERGWGGTYVEPAPINFASFLAEYRDEPRFTLIHAALAADSKLVELHDSFGDALSSTEPAHVARWTAAGVKFRPFLTKTVTWDEILDATGCDYTVLSLDVEGMSYELLRLLPLPRLAGLRLIVVEHDAKIEEAVAHVEPHGFKPLTLNGENLILIR